jgi:RsiW-degrading membrane proteinase PrsW (M82 family)
VNSAVAFLPVLLFLSLLVFLDSFKLVSFRAVGGALVAGGIGAVLAGLLNMAVAEATGLDALQIARTWAPVVEESLKALYVVWLVRRGRVGFLVDAAILGFAAGAGFALVENVDYLRALGERGLLLWAVRGFGTAMLHGGTTAIVALLTKTLHDRFAGRPLAALDFVPGLAVATLLHLLFNRAILPPVTLTLLLVVVLPVVMRFVFARSERATRAWLGVGLDSDFELLQSIMSGAVHEDTRVGTYLESLKHRFTPTSVEDMLRLLRIQLELSLQAKGLLLAREAGLEIPRNPDVGAQLKDLRALEHSLGRTAVLALSPILRRTSRDLWHLYVLERR